METSWLPALFCAWITSLAGRLDARQQARFVRRCTGLLFARGRRTVTSWLRACGVGRDYKPCCWSRSGQHHRECGRIDL
jgi:hypothetical protein